MSRRRRALLPLVLPLIAAAAPVAGASPPSGGAIPPVVDGASASRRGEGASAAPSSAADAGPPFREVRCVRDASFPSPWALPEASAAAEVTLLPHVREILVVADSGHDGAAMAWRPGGGAPRALRLPLDASASDDIEGMAWWSDDHAPVGDLGAPGTLYTLTSSGAVRRFVPDGAGGLRRQGDATPIGSPPLSCPDLRAGNCGKNWEGLCLRSHAGAAARPLACDGYAASKSEGALYCVVRDRGGRLAIDPSRPPVRLDLAHFPGRHDVLSDCAFGAPNGPARDVLLVTTNVFGGSVSYVVDEATGAAKPLDVLGTPSNEAIAVDSGGAFYEFLDDNGPTSRASRFACTGWP